MAAPLIISVSGLRGEIGPTFPPGVAMRYASAFSATLPAEGALVITRDGRGSGEMLGDAVHAALNGQGRKTLDGGIAATPTTGILVRQHHAAGGIQISASHNPGQYNGLKLFTSDGRIVPKSHGERVLALYRDEHFMPEWQPADALGRRCLIPDTITTHREAILKSVDVELIRSMKYRVLVDSNHGAGSVLVRSLLDSLGCETILLGGTPDGRFDHVPEPTAENLREIADVVSRERVDIAFCQDPDADRLAVIDEAGRYPGEEYTLALCAQNKLEKSERFDLHDPSRQLPLVVNCATSRMTADLAQGYGRETYRSAVGEANVVDLMLKRKAMFGGEGNGGPIDPAVGYVRDSFVGMANILELMARRGSTVSELVKSLPQWHIVKRKYSYPLDRVPELLSRLSVIFSEERPDVQDGLRLDRPTGWILVRGSNTESIIRIIAESETESSAEELCREMERAVDQCRLT